MPVALRKLCVKFGAAIDRSGVIRSSPAPCTRALKLLSLYAPFCSIFLTWSGASDGFFESSSATAPETIAADCEVPLPRKYRASIMPSGWLASM